MGNLESKRWNKCSACGKFVSYNDLYNGLVTVKMIYPDSEYTIETYEVLCKKCLKKERDQN